jgi:hypothetical protein
MSIPQRQFSAAYILAAAQLVGLRIAADRAPVLAEEVTVMYADIDRLAAVPLGETPPATAFDARWE